MPGVAGEWTLLGLVGVSQLGVVAHGLSAHCDLVGVVHEPIEDGIGQRRLADGAVPLLERDLAGDEGGATLIALVDDFEQVAAMGVGHGGHGKIIEDEDLSFGQGFHECGIAPVGAAEVERGEQLRQTGVEDAVALARGFVGERARQPSLTDACGAADEAVQVLGDPLAGGELRDERLVQAARGAGVEVFEGSGLAQFGRSQAQAQTPVVAFGEFAVGEQAQALLEAHGVKDIPIFPGCVN